MNVLTQTGRQGVSETADIYCVSLHETGNLYIGRGVGAAAAQHSYG